MISSISQPLVSPRRATPPANEPDRAASPTPVEDVASISSPARSNGSGLLRGLKKTGMMVALAACLAGPFTSAAQAQCQPQYYPQRPVAVRSYPGYGHGHQRRSSEPRIGISIGPGGIHVEAQIGRPRGWQRPPVVIQQPPVVIQQPPVIIQQPPIVIQQPPVVIQQPGWHWGR